MFGGHLFTPVAVHTSACAAGTKGQVISRDHYL